MNMMTSGTTILTTGKVTQAVTAPRAGAVAGILFAALFGVSVVMIRLSVPANSADASAWTPSALNRVTLALRLIPFAGIFFLWFLGVVRDRLGAAEDKFFATVTFGSALTFLALTLASCAVTEGLLQSLMGGDRQALTLEVYLLVRSVVDQAFNTFAVKLASVFMLSLATLWRSTHVMPRWLVYLTYLLGLGMLIAFGRSLWLLLNFPVWVLIVSVTILITNLRPKEV
jgi:hypothetical protein